MLYQINLTLSISSDSSDVKKVQDSKAKLFDLIKLFIESSDDNRMAIIEILDDQVLKNCGLIELQNFEKKKNRVMTKNL